MSKRNTSNTVRDILENAFGAFACAAITVFIAGGTLAMCVPGLVANLA